MNNDIITITTGTYRIRPVAVGGKFAHYAIISNNRRFVHKTITHQTPTDAIQDAQLWISRQS
jgi:hypothetical protein